GTFIYGVDYNWSVDGQPQSSIEYSVGDLYRYRYDPQQPRMLTASFSDMSADAMIHSGGGFVDSSNHLGCSAAPGRPRESAGFAIAFVALWGFAFVASRRRRKH